MINCIINLHVIFVNKFINLLYMHKQAQLNLIIIEWYIFNNKTSYHYNNVDVGINTNDNT